MKPRVLVIGAGAAGLMAAGRAAELGADVVLLEKMNEAGIVFAFPTRELYVHSVGESGVPSNVATSRDVS